VLLSTNEDGKSTGAQNAPGSPSGQNENGKLKMACCEIAPGLHVCRPDGEIKPVEGCRRKAFWCFKCRKRLMHTRMRFWHTQPSWYADWFWWECPRCHEENVLFPGREWVREC
jgi:hypothetical protein